MAKILVVDDDRDFIKITSMILQANNYEVVTAANGEQGLKAMRREKPALVILDVMMSYVLDGIDVRRTMAEDRDLKDIPVIMATSLTAAKAQGALPTDEYVPASEWIHKPIDPDVLLDRVKKSLGK
jgi:two-component system alkaline phosphatase synthesis response regulator PhoP